MQTSKNLRTHTIAAAPTGARRTALKATLLATALMLSGTTGWAQTSALPKGGAVNLAMVGEPQGLDPMISTADLVGTIMQHVYEPAPASLYPRAVGGGPHSRPGATA